MHVFMCVLKVWYVCVCVQVKVDFEKEEDAQKLITAKSVEINGVALTVSSMV